MSLVVLSFGTAAFTFLFLAFYGRLKCMEWQEYTAICFTYIFTKVVNYMVF